MNTADDILIAIGSLSEKHVLKNAPLQYRENFSKAAAQVYNGKNLVKYLQDKFFIPNDASFNVETYLQSASELSVQNHLMINANIRNLSIEKAVNPPKDVDVYYEINRTKVSL